MRTSGDFKRRCDEISTRMVNFSADDSQEEGGGGKREERESFSEEADLRFYRSAVF